MASAIDRTYLFEQVSDDGVHEEECSFTMTIACPLCANPNEVLSQPSSIGWKQVACSSCEVNLVLVREPSSGAPRRPLTSAIRLMSPLSGARPRAAIVRSRLFLVVATVFAFGVLGYLFWGMGFF
jgi:ribosomal protein S27E